MPYPIKNGKIKNKNVLKCSQDLLDYNNSEKQLKKIGSEELIGIEHASEIVKCLYLHKPNFFESIFKKIKNESFYKIDYINTLKGPVGFNLNEKFYNTSTEFQKAKKKVQILKNKNIDYIFTIVSVDTADNSGGGHYCALIYDVKLNIVEIFDAMSCSKKGSEFTEYFMNISTFLFDTNSKLLETCPTTKKECYQPTGGFISKKFKIIDHQIMDSQHHFCYMESILSLIEKFMNYKVKVTYTKHTKSNKTGLYRLVSIKKFIWLILHYMSILTINKSIYKYLLDNFIFVWHNKSLIYNFKSSKWIISKRNSKFQSYKIQNMDDYNYISNVLSNGLIGILDEVHNVQQI